MIDTDVLGAGTARKEGDDEPLCVSGAAVRYTHFNPIRTRGEEEASFTKMLEHSLHMYGSFALFRPRT